ncbi:MAG: type VI secretion system baseplate subunit TssE [Isosphaeraceae bacterium]|nr:type VI secretion system baseplate subunit TssE [Isosphaeraceae bacterium]
MSSANNSQRLLPSVLSRLIDPDYEGKDWDRECTVEQIVASVFDDLRDLLNTHPSINEIDEQFKELRTSILSYGMPDLASLSIIAKNRQVQLTQVVQAIITKFEPRLKDVKATMVGGEKEGDRNIAFSIKATLRTDPFPPVAFETIFDLVTGQADVKPREMSS